MKKKWIIILILVIISSLYIIVWNGKKTVVTEDKSNTKASERVTETKDSREINQLSLNESVPYDENICVGINNPYFYENESVNLTATLTYYGTDTEVVRDGTLEMKLVKNYENGDLFKLSVANEENIQDCLGEDRLNTYFYVTDDKIYRLWAYICQDEEVIRFYNDDDLIVKYLDTDDKLIANGELVCCEEDVTDELQPKQGGVHVTISHPDNQTVYNRVELKEDGSTHYYESYVWEKGKGLVENRSGFRIEADILYIKNINQIENVKIEEESVDTN